MTKQELNNLIQQAENTKDMDHAEKLYEQILNRPELVEHKSKQVIADIKWNRALNLAEIAKWYLSNAELNEEGEEVAKTALPIRAHTMQQLAVEEIIGAEFLYPKKSDKQLAKNYLRELKGELDEIESIIDSKTATIPSLEQCSSLTSSGPVAKKPRFGESQFILMTPQVNEVSVETTHTESIAHTT